jgi:4-hydroxyphenylpyruvate dioxygenase-like putative hemolysin
MGWQEIADNFPTITPVYYDTKNNIIINKEKVSHTAKYVINAVPSRRRNGPL